MQYKMHSAWCTIRRDRWCWCYVWYGIYFYTYINVYVCICVFMCAHVYILYIYIFMVHPLIKQGKYQSRPSPFHCSLLYPTIRHPAPNTRLGSDKYKLLSYWFDYTRVRTQQQQTSSMFSDSFQVRIPWSTKKRETVAVWLHHVCSICGINILCKYYSGNILEVEEGIGWYWWSCQECTWVYWHIPYSTKAIH